MNPAFPAAALYLAATAPFLVLRGDVSGGLLAAAHLAGAPALVALSLRLRRAGPPSAWEWLPLLLLPLLYRELPLLNQWRPGFHDDLVRAWEARLFPALPARTWAATLPDAVLSEVLHLAYLAFYPLVYLPPLLPYLRGDTAAFRRTCAGLLFAFTACYLAFVLFPVQGPRYFAAPTGVPDGPVRRLVLRILEAGSSPGSAFPSSHVAVAVAQTCLAWRMSRGMGAALAGVTILLTAGTVYGGFHYGVDAVAGAAVGVACAVVAGHLVPARRQRMREARRLHDS